MKVSLLALCVVCVGAAHDDWAAQSERCLTAYSDVLHTVYESFITECLAEDDPALVQSDASTTLASTDAACVRHCMEKLHPAASHGLPANSTVPRAVLGVYYSYAHSTCRCDLPLLHSDASDPVNFALPDAGHRALFFDEQTSAFVECAGARLVLPLGCLWLRDGACSVRSGDSFCRTYPTLPVKATGKCCVPAVVPGATRYVKSWSHPLTRSAVLSLLSFGVLLVLVTVIAQRHTAERHEWQPSPTSIHTGNVAKHKLGYEAFLQRLAVSADTEPAGDEECVICLGRLRVPSEKCCSLPCGHRMHFGCIRDYVLFQVTSKWEHPECPVCRRRVVVSNDVSICPIDTQK